jgi:ribosomal protein L40E
MDPFFAFLLVFMGLVMVCLGATASSTASKRGCASCNRPIPVQATRCRYCGYETRQRLF